MSQIYILRLKQNRQQFPMIFIYNYTLVKYRFQKSCIHRQHFTKTVQQISNQVQI